MHNGIIAFTLFLQTFYIVYIHINQKHAYKYFFNDTATTEIYTLSLHDALPI